MLCLAFLASAATALLLRGRESVSLEPDYVADLLLSVQEEWINDAVRPNGLPAMKESCAKVATAIIQGSEGDESKVEEYFDTVCSQKVFTQARPWQGDLCRSFAQKMTSAMKSDPEYNRNYLDVEKVCASLYAEVERTGAVEDKRREQARIEAEAAAKKKREEEKEAEKKKKALEKEAEKKRNEKEARAKKEADDKKRNEVSMKHAHKEMVKAHELENHAMKVAGKSTSSRGPEKPKPKPEHPRPHPHDIKKDTVKAVAAANEDKPDTKDGPKDSSEGRRGGKKGDKKGDQKPKDKKL